MSERQDRRVQVDIEVSPGKWATVWVTFEDRRNLIMAAHPLQRFVDDIKTMKIACFDPSMTEENE